jgi:RNA polymerase sigma-70 factor (ECF subfamily)
MARDLVERAIGGEHEAFSALAALWIDRLYAIARLILRDDDAAQDATQEALVVAWRDIRVLRDPDRFDAWIRRVLVRSCYHEARRTRTRHQIEGLVRPLDDQARDPGSSVAERDELERAFRHLSAEGRALIVLRFFVGLSMAETADALGLPIGTVKSRLHRTTQSIRAMLDADARLAMGVPQA